MDGAAEGLFGDYEILERIAAGGMAEVFRAKKRGADGFEKIVALKKILPHLSGDPSFVEMFRAEARIAAGLVHPGIVQVLDFGRVDGAYFLAMEYVHGRDLRAALSALGAGAGDGGAAGVPPALAVHVGVRMAEALDYAHNQTDQLGRRLRAVHRDLTPSNVLLSFQGEVKIADFGIAKAASSTDRTQAGILKGKASYMSPEQAWGKPLDGRSDLFALGAVMHEMLTGQKLFAGENELAALEQVRAAAATPPSTAAPHVPPELDRVILQALSREPEHRPASAGELARALRAAAAASGLPALEASDVGAWLRGLFPEAARVPESPVETSTYATPSTKVSPAPATAPRPAARARVLILGGVALAAASAAWIVVTRHEPDVATEVSQPAPTAGHERELATVVRPESRMASHERDPANVVRQPSRMAEQSVGVPSAVIAAEPPETGTPRAERVSRRRRATAKPRTESWPPAGAPPLSAGTAPSPVAPPAALASGSAVPSGPGLLTVEVSEDGCRVFVDDREVALAGRLAPVAGLPLGTHVIRVESPGRLRPLRKVVELTAGSPSRRARVRADDWVIE